MTKRIGKIEQFEFGSLSNGKHLHVTLAVSGFCGDDDDEGDVCKSIFIICLYVWRTTNLHFMI